MTGATSSGPPTVVVVVVNWNGKHLLGDCLQSLSKQDYPEDRYQVIVVDNGSTDGSTEWMRRHYPSVRVIDAGSNLGFAAANNLAIAQSDSDYVALLNNDAAAESPWLTELVSVAEADPRVGAVNAKIWLTDNRLPIALVTSGCFVPGAHDPRRLAAKVAVEALAGGSSARIEFTQGAFGLEHDPHGSFRWVSPSAEIRVPIHDVNAGEVSLSMLPAPYPGVAPPRITFAVGGKTVSESAVPGDHAIDIKIPFVPEDTRPVIQNAGSIVLPDGAGSDRGTVIVGGEAYYDLDRGQYDAIEEVPAFCGAACLLRRAALEDVGVFDGGFFMYYEDTDLSLRLRKAGWRVLYAPSAHVRHTHSATSVEWSPMFCYFTERNRLLMLIKNEPARVALREWAIYTKRLLGRHESSSNRKRYLRVQRSLLSKLPGALAARRAAITRDG